MLHCTLREPAKLLDGPNTVRRPPEGLMADRQLPSAMQYSIV